jgi:hypothetical protein
VAILLWRPSCVRSFSSIVMCWSDQIRSYDPNSLSACGLLPGRLLPSSLYARDELDIDLDALAWNRERAFGFPFGAWMVFLQRNAADVVTPKDLQDGGRRHVDLIVVLEIETHAHGPVTSFFANPKDQRDDLWRDAVANHGRFAGPVSQTLHPFLLKKSREPI